MRWGLWKWRSKPIMLKGFLALPLAAIRGASPLPHPVFDEAIKNLIFCQHFITPPAFRAACRWWAGKPGTESTKRRMHRGLCLYARTHIARAATDR